MWIKNTETGEIADVNIIDNKYAQYVTEEYADKYFEERRMKPRYEDDSVLLLDAAQYDYFIMVMESIQDMIRSYYNAREESFNQDKLDAAFDEVKFNVPTEKMESAFDDALWEIEYGE